MRGWLPARSPTAFHRLCMALELLSHQKMRATLSSLLEHVAADETGNRGMITQVMLFRHWKGVNC